MLSKRSYDNGNKFKYVCEDFLYFVDTICKYYFNIVTFHKCSINVEINWDKYITHWIQLDFGIVCILHYVQAWHISGTIDNRLNMVDLYSDKFK